MPFQIIKSGMMTFLLCSIIIFSVSTAGARDFTEFPQLKQGQKIRIGYLEGGPFFNYHLNLVAFVNGLVNLGWMEDPNFPEFPNTSNTKDVWKWLVAHTKSNYLVFVKDGFYSNNWDKKMRSETRL